MSGPASYTNLGDSTCKRVSDQAALLAFPVKSLGDRWIPFSQLSPETLAQCVVGVSMSNTRVTKWFVGRMDPKGPA